MTQSNDNKTSLVRRLAARREEKVHVAIDDSPDRCLRAEACRRGWQLVNIWHCGGKIQPWMTCQGAIVTRLADSELVQDLRAAGCKVVRLGHLPHPMDDQVPAVLSDFQSYGAFAAEHFHERNFQNVGFVGRDPWSDMETLYEGFSERAKELAMGCHLLRFKDDRSIAAATKNDVYLRRSERMAEWLVRMPKPLGLLTPGDWVAAELCFMITQAGFDVPADVAVLGRGNDVGLCESAMPPISSFADNREARVHAACDLLARWLDGEPPPKVPVWVSPLGIVERQSTHVLAVENPTVARALAFVWENYSEDLTVNDVAEAVAVSRSKLDHLFRQYHSRGVKSELKRKRLEKCRQLLRTTSMTIARIATTVGFSSPEYLCDVFHRTYGLSPRDFRRQHRE